MEKCKSHFFEDVSIKVMYFFNSMDTFLPFSCLLYLLAAYFMPQKRIFLMYGNFFLSMVFLWIFYYKLKLVDFFPSILICLPLELIFLFYIDKQFFLYCKAILPVMFVITSIFQIVFMNVPMMLAARDFSIPFRMYFNSFFIISPTTLSIPLNLIYQIYILSATKVLSENFTVNNRYIVTYILVSIISGIIAARFKKSTFVPNNLFRPESKTNIYKRVLLLNIDGLSYDAFNSAKLPFLHLLASKYWSVKGGAVSVYRALTNPAFISILTGTPPQVHGVINNNRKNNFSIEALPDYIPSKIFGSMHVRHFSRSNWHTYVYSLITHGYDKADNVLIEDLKKELKKNGDTKLWIVDLSKVDYSGHAWGGYTKKYFKAIEDMDVLIRGLFAWMDAEKLLKDTLVIISSDHGLFIGEHSFMLNSKEERVPLVVVGEGIYSCRSLEKASIMDINVIISYALKEHYCRDSKGNLPRGLFIN